MSIESYERMYRVWQAKGLMPLPREENSFNPSEPKQNQQLGQPKQSIGDEVLDQVFEFVSEELTEVRQDIIEQIAYELSLNVKDVLESLIVLQDQTRIEVEKGRNGSIYFMKSL